MITKIIQKKLLQQENIKIIHNPLESSERKYCQDSCKFFTQQSC